MMNFYVRISDVFEEDENNLIQRVEYVEKDNATMYESVSEAALAAEAMAISGFDVSKI